VKRRPLAHFATATHDGDTVVTEVMFTRLMGVALMKSPLMITV
jgi:hypothetical protein